MRTAQNVRNDLHAATERRAGRIAAAQKAIRDAEAEIVAANRAYDRQAVKLHRELVKLDPDAGKMPAPGEIPTQKPRASKPRKDPRQKAIEAAQKALRAAEGVA